MPLQPENNKKYWPLLLTDDLYLLPHELSRPLTAGQKATAAEATAESQQESNAQVTQQTAGTATSLPQPDLLWGSLERGILVLVDYPAHPLLERTDGLFLVEILKALGLEFKHVATINISRLKTAADWEWLHSLPWQYAVCFGIQHPELDFSQQISQYQKIGFRDKTVLLAESLSEIRADQGRKRKLWNLLKQAFV